MPRFWPRLLKSVLPITLLCGAGGVLFAVAAGSYVTDKRSAGDGLRDLLLWRVPFAMAAWGGGLTFLFELFRHWWASPPEPPGSKPATPEVVDAEKLLLQLLELAEEAERSRQSATLPRPSVTTDTPAPAGQPTPVA